MDRSQGVTFCSHTVIFFIQLDARKVMLTVSFRRRNKYNRDRTSINSTKFASCAHTELGDDMLSKKPTILDLVLYISLLLPIPLLLINNPDTRIELFLLTSAFVLLQLIRYHRIDPDLTKRSGAAVLFGSWCLAFAIQWIDGSFVPQVYFFILLAEAAYKKSAAFSVPFTVLCYLGFVFGVYAHEGLPPIEDMTFVIPRALEYWLIFGFSVVTQRANMQKEQLNRAYERLQESSQQLEEKVMMEERMNLSREIHDTIGHSLTTALVGMETGKQLVLHNKPQEAVHKLDAAKEQVKNSLHNVRKSIHTLYEEHSFVNFRESLHALIEETRQVTGVHIDADFGELPPLTDQQKLTLYRALQEGLTNGIRHGRSTSFNVTLTREQPGVRFCLEDNGQFPIKWRLGFGLSTMKERVDKLGGTFQLSKTPDGGCQLNIYLPV